jgi:hypothetical protein
MVTVLVLPARVQASGLDRGRNLDWAVNKPASHDYQETA